MHQKDPVRQMRSYRTCWLPADHPELVAPPRPAGAYVPELAALIDNDRDLTGRARRCAGKLAEYIYRRDRDSRTAQITVTWLMKTRRKSRRTVQRCLRQLERAGYINVAVIHSGIRMCAGLVVELLSALITLPPRGHSDTLVRWPRFRPAFTTCSTQLEEIMTPK